MLGDVIDSIRMLAILYAFFVGLIMGSFLNVVALRLKDGETLMGRSYCYACGHQIRWYDNIPVVSYLWLRGKCRDCGISISWQYPAMELVTGMVYALTVASFFVLDSPSSWLETIWFLVVVSLFIIIAAYDLRNMEIPLAPLAVAGALTMFSYAIQYAISGEPFWQSRLGLGVAGGVMVGAFFFALVFASRETWMGWGDVWLGLVCGLIVGIPAALFMLTTSFAVGAATGIVGIASGNKHLKSQIPFAPFLVFGTVTSLFLFALFPSLRTFFFL